MPDSTGALINQLANPPSPFDYLSKATNALTSARQFQANQAVSEAYRQSVDPETGAFDQNKFNALASQGPGSWNFGATMQQAGQGLGAQAQGTQADLQTRLHQQQTALAYMTPLYQKSLDPNQKVTGNDVSDALDNIPPGVLPGPMIANLRAKAAQIGDGDAKGMVQGGYYATDAGIRMMNEAGPKTIGVPTGGGTQYVPSGERYPSGVGRGNAYIPNTLSPGEASQLDDVIDTANVHHQIPHALAAGVLGQPVPGGPPNIVYQTNNGPIAAAPATPGGTPPVRGSTAAPPPPGRILAPTAPVAQPPGSPTSLPTGPTLPGGATLGTGPSVGTVQTQQASADAYNAIRADIPASQNRVFTMQQALEALGSAKTGPGTETTSKLAGIAGTWAPDFVKGITGYDVKQLATDRDKAEKYLQQVANVTAQTTGMQGSDARLAATVTANPNIHVQDQAADQVLRVNIGMQQMEQYMWKQAQAQGVQPNQYSTWAANWATTHDPRAFILNVLTPKDHKALIDSVMKNGKATREGVMLANTVNELRKNGAMPGETTPPGQE